MKTLLSITRAFGVLMAWLAARADVFAVGALVVIVIAALGIACWVNQQRGPVRQGRAANPRQARRCQMPAGEPLQAQSNAACSRPSSQGTGWRPRSHRCRNASSRASLSALCPRSSAAEPLGLLLSGASLRRNETELAALLAQAG
jgi:uncharacterized protein YhdP